jgi:hypothetical protein
MYVTTYNTPSLNHVAAFCACFLVGLMMSYIQWLTIAILFELI